MVERRDLPKVNVTLVTRAGAVGDPAGKAGVANLTMTAIDLGTKTRNALEIEEAFGDLGTTLTGGAGRESARLGLDVLSRNLSPALGVLADVVQNPTFPEERDRARTQAAARRASRRRTATATRWTARIQPMLAFGPEHPYGRPVQGLQGSVEGITRDDLVAFHQARVKPGSTAIVLAGDISLAQATELATQALRRVDGRGRGRDHDSAGAGAEGRPHLPGGPPRRGADRRRAVDARTGADVAGLRRAEARRRGLGRRRLRHAAEPEPARGQGLLVRRVLDPQPVRAAGIWSAAGGVQTNKTKESIVEFDKELKDLAGARPISAEELAVAKQRRVRGYAQQFESLDRITEEIANLWALGLPTAELQREYDATNGVTLEQIAAASKKYVQPAQASLLLVGDRAKIEAKVKALNLGEIVLLDNEGKPVAATGGTK